MKSITVEQLDSLFSEFYNFDHGDSFIYVNGIRHTVDWGYGMEFLELFLDWLKSKAETGEENER